MDTLKMNMTGKFSLTNRYGDKIHFTYLQEDRAWLVDCTEVSYTSIIWVDDTMTQIKSFDPEGLYHIGLGSVIKNPLNDHETVVRVEMAGDKYKLYME
jgi:hypothetical protein